MFWTCPYGWAPQKELSHTLDYSSLWLTYHVMKGQHLQSQYHKYHNTLRPYLESPRILLVWMLFCKLFPNGRPGNMVRVMFFNFSTTPNTFESNLLELKLTFMQVRGLMTCQLDCSITLGNLESFVTHQTKGSCFWRGPEAFVVSPACTHDT